MFRSWRMKPKRTLIFTLITFLMLTLLPNDSFAQGALSEPSVRLIYFLPNDRPAQPDRIEAFRQLIKDAQQFFADEIERHGYGRKTFRVETDGNGEPIVHQFQGRFNERHYYQRLSDKKIWEEFFPQVNDLQHVYLIAIDLSYELLNEGGACGLGGVTFFPLHADTDWFFGSAAVRHRDETQGEQVLGGSAIIPASGHCFYDTRGFLHPLRATTHELAHAFGLEHNKSDLDSAVGGRGFRFSECDAEWLSVSRFFNSKAVSENASGNIQLISAPTYSPEGITLRFEVTDTDGLHQAQLLVPKDGSSGPWKFVGCQALEGHTQRVEFLSSELTSAPERVALQFMDDLGNITWATFLVDIASVLPLPKVVSMPDPILAAAVREALGLGENARMTDRQLLKLSVLEVRAQGIQELTGLEHARNLTKLLLRQNNISDVSPLSPLRHLTVLDLNNNTISDISALAHLRNLTHLLLFGSSIRDISAVANLTHLQLLVLAKNNISDISALAPLRNLEELHLQGNQIRDVSPLVNLTALTELRLEGNPIYNHKTLLPLLKKNPDLKIYLKEGGEPLPVTLSHFRAELTDAGVLIKWATESELDNAGFYIYRSETKAGEFKIVNPRLIQGAGTSSERNTYTWTDTTTKPNTVYYYQIEDVSHAGDRKQLATVRLRGLVSASGKLRTLWGDLKAQN